MIMIYDSDDFYTVQIFSYIIDFVVYLLVINLVLIASCHLSNWVFGETFRSTFGHLDVFPYFCLIIFHSTKKKFKFALLYF